MSTSPSTAASRIRDPTRIAVDASRPVTPFVVLRKISAVRAPARCAKPRDPNPGTDRCAISPAINASPPRSDTWAPASNRLASSSSGSLNAA